MSPPRSLRPAPRQDPTGALASDPQITILIPVLGRPHRVAPVLDSIARTAPRADVLFIASRDDRPEQLAIEEAGAAMIRHTGNYAAKINEGVRRTDTPLLFLGADDLEFHDGWLEAAVGKLREGIGVVGTNDLCNARVMAGLHSTHSLVTRSYCALGTADEPGKLLHEGYPHEYVDDEFIETAVSRAAFDFAFDAVVEHLHPQVGKAPMDALYAQQRRRMRRGRKIFRERRHLWT